MNPLSQILADRFIQDFWSANHSIHWLAVEQEHSLWLSPNTVLLGKIDAIGVNDAGEPFFGDWKSLSANRGRYIESVKAEWRTMPQSLTYGLLLSDLQIEGKPIRNFTVRWIIKPKREGDPATTAFEWYSYGDAELDHWRGELLVYADDIRHRRNSAHEGSWHTRWTSCLKYGPKYPCPFYHGGCSKLDFAAVPEGMHPREHSHLAIEDQIKRDNFIAPGVLPDPDLVILDATRVGDWIDCEQKYHKLWEGDGLTEDSEALTIGSEMHSLIAAQLQPLIQS